MYLENCGLEWILMVLFSCVYLLFSQLNWKFAEVRLTALTTGTMTDNKNKYLIDEMSPNWGIFPISPTSSLLLLRMFQRLILSAAVIRLLFTDIPELGKERFCLLSKFL